MSYYHNSCTKIYYYCYYIQISIHIFIILLIKWNIIIIRSKNIDALASVYEDVDDIDFYAAGILEELKPGATSGHTFQCIMGEMFYRLKFGDRFYYEFGNQTGSFTLGKYTIEYWHYHLYKFVKNW